jgi:hypothetical protein
MLNAPQHTFLYWGRKKAEVTWSKLFSDPNHRWNCLVLHILWAVTIVTYYGALLNVKNVGEHLHFNTAMAGNKYQQTKLSEVSGSHSSTAEDSKCAGM